MRLLFNRTSPTAALTRLYFFTVLAVTGLTVGGQLLTQRSLSLQKSDGRVINIAGRQRMLSQKIAKVASALQAQSLNLASDSRIDPVLAPGNSLYRSNALKELEAAVELFRSAHTGLKDGSASLNLPGNNSPTVTALFQDIEPHYQAMSEAAGQLLQPTVQPNPVAVQTIFSHEDDFLLLMNSIVSEYEKEAYHRVIRLQQLQQLCLWLTLLVLLPMLLPMCRLANRIHNLIHTMRKSGMQVQSSSIQLAATGHQLSAMATEQAAASTRITASSKKIVATARQLDQAIEAVSSQAKSAAIVATAGEQSASKTAQELQQLEDTSTVVNSKLAAISDRAQTIDQAIDVITKVADQTNLLSLNAAIEAEKAGEYGAGFSVVAREIRRLADQTAAATLDIEMLAKEMHSAVSSGVIEMESFSHKISDSIVSTRQVTTQLSMLSEEVRSLLKPLQDVGQITTSQSQSAAQIQAALERLSLGSQETAQSLRSNQRALTKLQEAAASLHKSSFAKAKVEGVAS